MNFSTMSKDQLVTIIAELVEEMKMVRAIAPPHILRLHDAGQAEVVKNRKAQRGW